MGQNTSKLESLSINELTDLYERVRSLLAKRIEEEKRKLEETLAKLSRGPVAGRAGDRRVIVPMSRSKQRRKYPPVLPKYRNPADRSQTWAGRGKRPKWLASQLKAGKKIEDFLIKSGAAARGARA